MFRFEKRDSFRKVMPGVANRGGGCYTETVGMRFCRSPQASAVRFRGRCRSCNGFSDTRFVDLPMESMKNVLQLLCAVLFVLAMSAETVRADLLAYEGFNYETNHVGSLNGLSGGAPVSDYGWASGWSHEFYSSKDDKICPQFGQSGPENAGDALDHLFFFMVPILRRQPALLNFWTAPARMAPRLR